MHRGLGINISNLTDGQIFNSEIQGARYGIYGGNVSGWNGKHIGNHVWNTTDDGWLVAGVYLGGANTVTIQCDTPVVFCHQFLNVENTEVGSGLNGGTYYSIIDNATWFTRLETGATTTVLGGYMYGYNSSLRINELSNAALAGNPSYKGPLLNYSRFGFNFGNYVLNILYDQSASTILANGGLGSSAYQIGVNLPTCNTSTYGQQYIVSNGIASPTFQQSVSTTGSSTQRIFCNGGGTWVYQ